MINRILIRIKVVQMLYSYLLDPKGMKLSDAHNELEESLNKSYELYHYLLCMPIELTKMQEVRLDNARNKYLPTEEDLHPNTKFVDNLLVRKLKECESLQEFVEENKLSWDDSEIYLKLVLDKILESEIYQAYMASDNRSLEEDSKLWRDIFRKIVLDDEDLAEALEAKSVYWNDDIDTIGTFVLKTFKRFEQEGYSELLPQFKDDEDRNLAKLLFDSAIQNKDEYMKLIEQFVSKESWEVDRLAFMDVIILLVALSEVEKVPSVPTKVTLNEYIEIAKCYSTSKSGQFVNGILNSIINYLKKEGKLFKN